MLRVSRTRSRGSRTVGCAAIGIVRETGYVCKSLREFSLLDKLDFFHARTHATANDDVFLKYTAYTLAGALSNAWRGVQAGWQSLRRRTPGGRWRLAASLPTSRRRTATRHVLASSLVLPTERGPDKTKV